MPAVLSRWSGEPMNNPRVTALKLIEQQAITLDELWIQYWANGGNARAFELEATFTALTNCARSKTPSSPTL